MSIIHGNSQSFDKIISQNKVLVDFWAPWCGPCRMLAPVLEELSEDMPNLVIAKINVDDEQQLAIKYGINSIPTLLYFENGTLKSKTQGFMEKSQLIRMLGIK